MKILLNNTEFTIPDSQAEFTLSSRIDFERKYGRHLLDLYKRVQQTKDDELKEAYTVDLQFERMFCGFSFFTGVSLDVIRSSGHVDQICRIYLDHIEPLFAEDFENMAPQSEFHFDGERWGLDSAEISRGGPMKFGQFIDAKQLVKDLSDLEAGIWEQTLPLSVIYLRKKGEQYTEELLYEGSDRLKLFEKLPMSIAVQVGFFLSGTTSFSKHISTFSKSPGQKKAVSTPPPTTTATAGSIFLSR